MQETTTSPPEARQSSGSSDPALAAKLAAAAASPGDVGAQVAAAYACQAAGRPRDSIEFYRAALTLGVPLEGRRVFLTGYAAALLSSDELGQAAAVLAEAVEAFPEDLVLRVMQALVQHHRGESDAAVAAFLTIILRQPELADDLGRYADALRGLRHDLAERAPAQPSDLPPREELHHA